LKEISNAGLYDPSFEKDSCGVGFVANIKGRKSHQIVSDALTMLERMAHRGACGCEPNTGDGAGILIQIPHEFFNSECSKLGFKLPALGQYGVGLVFFPRDPKVREECRTVLNRQIKKMKMSLLGYRLVPTHHSDLGETALSSEPIMEQVFIKRLDSGTDPEDFERKLFILRKYSTHIITESVKGVDNQFYFSSLSYKTISYKGMLTSLQMRPYFPDLEHEEVVSALAVIHSRFSTNTFPSWQLAHPYRYIAHNGEINTLKGNVNWMNARQSMLKSELFGDDLQKVYPTIAPGGSDSASFDNAVELLFQAGRSLPHVMAMLIPEAWAGNPHMKAEKRAFYEYHASLMEPWDGPAAVAFTDGKWLGATLDRNGLRPARYMVTTSNELILASETGVLPIKPEEVQYKGRLQPGRMLLVNLEEHRIVPDEEIKHMLASRQPYGEWLKENQLTLEQLPPPPRVYGFDPATVLTRQRAFGYSDEDLKMILAPMATNGEEPVG